MAQEERPVYNIDDAPALFEKFIEDYDREYKDEEEKEVRYQAFLESLKGIIERNAKETNPEMIYSINEFADLTTEEKNAMLNDQID
ncbi:actinidain-like [Pararge aegeria]|nr:actinidain-like [Pararge aegeria]